MTTMYTTQSIHDVGYLWNITAPDGLTVDDIAALQDALVDYTAAPDMTQMFEMLEDPHYCSGLDASKMELFKQVAFSISPVYRIDSVGRPKRCEEEPRLSIRNTPVN